MSFCDWVVAWPTSRPFLQEARQVSSAGPLRQRAGGERAGSVPACKGGPSAATREPRSPENGAVLAGNSNSQQPAEALELTEPGADARRASRDPTHRGFRRPQLPVPRAPRGADYDSQHAEGQAGACFRPAVRLRLLGSRGPALAALGAHVQEGGDRRKLPGAAGRGGEGCAARRRQRPWARRGCWCGKGLPLPLWSHPGLACTGSLERAGAADRRSLDTARTWEGLPGKPLHRRPEGRRSTHYLACSSRACAKAPLGRSLQPLRDVERKKEEI